MNAFMDILGSHTVMASRSIDIDSSYTLRLRDGEDSCFFGAPITLIVEREGKPMEPDAHVFCSCDSKGSKDIFGWVKNNKAVLDSSMFIYTGSEMVVQATLFVNGPQKKMGDERQRISITLRNPVKTLTAVHQNGKLQCTVELLHKLPTARLSLNCGGEHIGSLPIPDTAMGGTYTLPAPRRSGTYEVSIRYSTGSDNKPLRTCTVAVHSPEGVFSLRAVDPLHASGSVRALMAPPQSVLTFQARGPIDLARDIVTVLPITTMDAPTIKQIRSRKTSLQLTKDGTATYIPTEEGLYQVVLAINHMDNHFLVGDYGILLVTKMVYDLQSDEPQAKLITGTSGVHHADPAQVVNN